MSRLLLNIDDATKVAMRFLREYVSDPDELEDLVHCEMEQNSYLCKMGEHDPRKDLAKLIMDINPRVIGEQIAEGEIRDWCADMQIMMQYSLIRMGRADGGGARMDGEEG